ncbi:hypothetical protein, partial [Phenylobacterium sp.]|uniref:beta strand repeat-containing protein n=1 Tax=Phenylobacterium sp. TaxID=1871053 RepID=UPI0025F223DE
MTAAATTGIAAQGSRRARLLGGSALYYAGLYYAGLGGAAALLLATAAPAQTLPAIPDAAAIAVATGGAQPTITAPDANSLDVDLKSTRTVINWDSFHVSAADKVTFHFGATSDIVLNKSPTQVKVDAGGQVAGLVGADPGGNIWFYSPQGVVISPGAVMTAGAFVFARGDDIVDMAFVDAAAPLSVLRTASDSLIKIDTIGLATTASINDEGELVLSATTGDLAAEIVLAAKGATVTTLAGGVDVGEVTAGEVASVTATGGDITLTSLNGGAGARASGAVVTVDTAAASDSSADIEITGLTRASLGSGTAGRDIKVAGPAASLGSGSAGRDLFVTATTGAAGVTGTVSAARHIEVTTTTGDVVAGSGTLNSSGGHVLARSTGGAVTLGAATTQDAAADVTVEAATTASLGSGSSGRDIKLTAPTATLGGATAARDVLVAATTGPAGVTGTATGGRHVEVTATTGDVAVTGALKSTGGHVLAKSTAGSASVGSAITEGTDDVTVEGATTAALASGASGRDIKVTGPAATIGGGTAARDVLVTASAGNAGVTGTVAATRHVEVQATGGDVAAAGGELVSTGAGGHVLAKSTTGGVDVGSAATTDAAGGDVAVEAATSALLTSGQSARNITVGGPSATLGGATAAGDVFVTGTTSASVTGAVTAGDDIEVTANGSISAASATLKSTGIGAGDDAHVLVKSAGGSATVGSAITQGTSGALGDVTVEAAGTARLNNGQASRDIVVRGPAATLGAGSAGRHVFVTATTGAASVTGAVSAGNDIEVTSDTGNVSAAGGSLTSTGVGAGDDAHVLAKSNSGSVIVGSATTQGTGPALGDVTIESPTMATLLSGSSSRDIRVTAPTASLGSGSAARHVLVTATTGTASVTGTVTAGNDIEVTATTGSVDTGGGGLTSTGVGAGDDAHVLVKSTGGAVTVGSAATQGTGQALGDVTVDGATTATVTGTLRSTQDIVVQAASNVQAAAATMIANRDVAVRSASADVTVGTIRAGDDIAIRALSGAITSGGGLRSGTTQGTGDPSGATDTLAGATLTGHDIDLKAQAITITGDVAAGRTADAGETLDPAQLDSDVFVTVTAADPSPSVAALRLSTGNNSALTAHRDIVLKSEGAVAATLQTGDVFAGRDVAVHAPNGAISMRSARAGDDVVLRAPNGMVEVIGDVQAGRDLVGQPTVDADGAGDDLNAALPFMDFDGNPGTVFKVVGFDVNIVGQAVRITGTTVAGRQPSTDAPDIAGPVDDSTSDVRIETRVPTTPVIGLAPSIQLGGVIATRDIQIDSAKAVIAGDLKAGRDIAVLGRGGATPGAAANDHSGSGVTIASARAGDDVLAFSVYGRTSIVGGATSGAPFPRLPVNLDRVIDGATEAADQLAIYLHYLNLDEESAPLLAQGAMLRLVGQGVTVGGDLAAVGANADVRVRSTLDIDVGGSASAGRRAMFSTDDGGGALKVGAVTAARDVFLDGAASVEATGTLTSTGSDVAVRSRGGGQVRLAGLSAGDDIVVRTTGAVIVNGAVSTGGGGDSVGLGDDLRAGDGAITLEGVTFDLTGRDIDIVGGSVTTTGSMSAMGGDSDVRIQSAGALDLGALSAGRDVLVDGASTVSTGMLTAGRDVGVRSTGDGAAVTVGGATAGDDVVIRGKGAITVTGDLRAGAGADSTDADQAGDLVFGAARTRLAGDFDLAGRNIDLRSSAGPVQVAGSSTAATDARFQTAGLTGAGVKVAAVSAGRDILLDGAAAAGSSGVEATGALVAALGDVAVRARNGGAIRLKAVTAGDDVAMRTTGALVTEGTVSTTGAASTLGAADRLTDASEAGRLAVGGASFDLSQSDIDVVAGQVNIFRSAARGSARVKAGAVSMSGGAAVGVDILIDSEASLSVGDLMASGDIALRSRTGSLVVGALVAGDDIVLRGATGVRAVSLKAGGVERLGVGDQMYLSDPTMLGGELSLLGGTIDVRSSGGAISIGAADSAGDVRVQAAGGEVTLSGLINAGRDIFVDGGSVNATGGLTAGGDVALYGRTGTVSVGSVTAGDDLVIRAQGDVTATGELKSGQRGDVEGLGDRLIAATGPTSIFGAETSAVGGVIDIRGASIRLGGVINAAGEAAHLRLKSGGVTMLGDATLTGDIAIDSVGDVTGGALTAGRDLAVRSLEGAVSLASGAAGDDIVLRAARAITVTGALSIVGQGADAQGFGDVLFDLARTSLGGDFALSGRNLDILSTSGDVTVGALSAPDDIRIQAAAGRVTAADVDAGHDVLLDGGGVSAGAVRAGADLAVRATNGALILGSARAGDDLVVRAQGDITVTGALTAGGGADSSGAGDRLAALDGGATDLGGANIDIRSAAGGVSAQGSLSATDDVRLSAAGAVSNSGRIDAGRDVRLQAAGVAIGGELRAGRDAVLDATGAVAITGKVAAGRDALLRATGDVAAAGEVEAGRDVMLDGASVVAGAVRAGRDVAARGRTGSLTLGSITAGDDVVLRAAQGITVTGQVTAQGGPDGDGVADELFAADRTALGGDFDLAGSNIDIRGGAIDVTGSATAGRDARFQTRGDAALGLGAVTAGGDILADGRAVTATGRLSAGRDVAIRARAGGVELASVAAGDDIAIRATGAVRASGTLTSGTGANADGAADRLISAAEGGAIMRLVDPLVATAVIQGFTLSGGDIDIRSGDAISLGGDVGAANIRLQAATKITLASATASDSIFTRAADVSLGGAWRAQRTRIEVTAASLNLGDGATGMGGVTLSSEQFGRIDSAVVQIFLGDTSGAARGGNISIGALAVDTARIRTSLELYAGGASDVVITGAFAPNGTAANTTLLRIGAPDAAGDWTPRSIRVIANSGGSIGSALTTGGRSFTDVRAFNVVELNARADILMGYQDFIDRILATSAAGVPGVVKGVIAPQTTSGPRILVTAGALVLRADGKVAQQDTGGLLGTTPTGLYLLGGRTPQLLLGRTSATPGLPEFIELNGALTSGTTIMVGESVSLLAGIAFDRGVTPSGYYRLNTCAILQQGSCMPSNGHPTISIPPEQLTGLTLEDRTAAA